MKKITKQKDVRSDALIRKLEKLYQNYGIDIAEMGDEEFERLKMLYEQNKRNIDEDLKDSERYQGRFDDDIL